MKMYGFGPASKVETIVYGAARPGYPSCSVSETEVRNWIDFMRDAGIWRIVCLLSASQLDHYRVAGRATSGLLDGYRVAFGRMHVLHAPIEDLHLCDAKLLLRKILPFLRASDRVRSRVLVHCSAGLGRTGHVLAAWLVHGRGLGPEDAIREVIEMGQNPSEAICAENATREQLIGLLKTAAAES